MPRHQPLSNLFFRRRGRRRGEEEMEERLSNGL
jgi:hypothetical protein